RQGGGTGAVHLPRRDQPPRGPNRSRQQSRDRHHLSYPTAGGGGVLRVSHRRGGSGGARYIISSHSLDRMQVAFRRGERAPGQPAPPKADDLPPGWSIVKNDISELIGLEIADGRYKVLGRIGQGSMGSVYCAFDRNLQTDVVLKFPVARDQAAEDSDFRERFGREIRSLVTLSHPHIVKIIDVGEFRDSPYVVMQYLAGGSLKDRMVSGPAGEIEPMPLPSLREWLLEIAKALDFIHSQQYIHRDVKPASILFDRHGNVFLGDFGIIKALTSETADWKGNSVTAPGFLVGTPNYVAPEVVMGRLFDGRVDQYSLAMSIYEVLAGHN